MPYHIGCSLFNPLIDVEPIRDVLSDAWQQAPLRLYAAEMLCDISTFARYRRTIPSQLLVDLPRRAVAWANDDGELSDYDWDSGCGFHVLSEEVRKDIEALEPGKHQFFELKKVVSPYKWWFQTVKNKYHLCVVAPNYNNFIVVEKSDIILRTQTDLGLDPYWETKSSIRPKFCVRREAIAGCHLWGSDPSEPLKGMREIFCSDELHKILVDGGYLGFEFTSCDVE